MRFLCLLLSFRTHHVLDAGSLMGAARRLQAQQPTLSRHIAELESQIGAPLFERTGRGVVPTALALAMAEGARQMEEGAGALGRAGVRTAARDRALALLAEALA